MTKHEKINELEVGYDVLAAIGMSVDEIQTPCLILDLDALERNIKKMGDYAKAHGMRLPFVYGRDDVKYIKCSDEDGVIEDKGGVLGINEKLKLVPGHCDPTCNVHDWYVGVRNGLVESIWPVSARGKAY